MKCLSCAHEFDFFSALFFAPHKKLLLCKMFAAQNRQHVVQNVDSFNCGGRVSSTFFNRRFQRRMSLGCCSPCRSFQSKKQNSYLSSASSAYSDISNAQNSGWGLDSNINIETKKNNAIFFFYRFWNIQDSEISTGNYANILVFEAYEPKNQTIEYGIGYSWFFN